MAADDARRERLRRAAEILRQVLLQDVESKSDDEGGGKRLRQGISGDRVCSVHDPEMRHGRKSASARFDGHQHGRHVRLHHQEARLQAARAWQRSSEFDDFRKRRQVVEHRIAGLVQLGIRQARYVGRRKTLFQVLLADAVAKLTLVASHAARMTQTGSANRPLGAVLAARRRLSRPLCRQPRVALRRSFRQRSWQARSVTAVYRFKWPYFGRVSRRPGCDFRLVRGRSEGSARRCGPGG